MAKTADVSHRSESRYFNFHDNLVSNFSFRDKPSPPERDKLGSSSDLICSNISFPGGGYRWSVAFLGWQ